MTVTDDDSNTGITQDSIVINALPDITTTTLPDGEVAVAYSQTLAAVSGKLPYTWTISDGELPDGIGLEDTTNSLSGTPAESGIFNFTVTVTDNNEDTDSQALSLVILNS